MKIQENILLKDFTTFRIGGRAKYFCVVKDEADLKEALIFANPSSNSTVSMPSPFMERDAYN